MSAIFAERANQYEDGDPRVIWDPVDSRWIATALSFDASCAAGHLYLSVSQTSDPNGIWNAYWWDYAGELPDQPTIGIAGDKVTIGINLYQLDPSVSDCGSNTFTGATLVVEDLAPVLVGNSASAVETATDPAIFEWQPSQSVTPGTTIYATFAALNSGVWDVGYATITGTAGAADVVVNKLDLTTTLGLPTFLTPAPPNQPGIPSTISKAVDLRPTGAVWQGGHLWFVSTRPCTPSGEAVVRDCVRVTELATGASPTLIQDFVISDVGYDSFMGGLGISGSGRIFVVYSRSSPSAFVSNFAYSQGPTAAPYSLDGPILITPGAATYNGQRWGDYVGIAADPVDPYAVWQADEYPNAGGVWATTVSRLAEDVTPPVGAVSINGGAATTSSSSVSLSVTATDDLSGVAQVLVSNDPGMAGATTSPYSTPISWTLLPGDGPKSVFVQWRDNAGNLSAIATASILVDTVAPTAAMGASAIATPTAASTTAIPVGLTWVGTDAGTGVAAFTLARSIDGGPFSRLGQYGPMTTSVVTYLTPAHRYQFEIQATDGAGNIGSWGVGPDMVVTAAQETSRSITYRGTWSLQSVRGALGGRTKSASVAGRSAAYRFTGRSIAWVAPTSSIRGSAKVYVDGVYRGLVSLYSSSTQARRIVYVRSWSSVGVHTIKVVVVGTRRHPRIDVDAFVVLR